MSLVTCSSIGESLQAWIRNASNRDKEDFANRLQDILEIDSGEGLIKWLKSADDDQLKQLSDAFTEVLKLDAGEGLSDWIKNASKKDKDDLKKALTDGLNINLSDELSNLSSKDLDSLADKLNGRIKIYTTNPILGDGTKKNPIGLSLAGGDNLLDLREDGLSYSEEAPADTSRLYVDAVSGDDNADGTQSNPLRTIHEALDRNKKRQSFVIYLHEDQNHEWRSSWGEWTDYAIRILPYGDSFEYYSNANPRSINYRRSRDVKRPTIKFIADNNVETTNGYYAKPTVMVRNQSSTVIDSCILDFSYSRPVDSESHGVYRGYFGQRDNGCSLHLTGCILIPNKDSDFYLSHTDSQVSLILDTCTIQYKSDGTLADGKAFFLGTGALLSLTIRGDGHGEDDEIAGTTEDMYYLKTMDSSEWGQYFDGLRTEGLGINIRTTADIGV